MKTMRLPMCVTFLALIPISLQKDGNNFGNTAGESSSTLKRLRHNKDLNLTSAERTLTFCNETSNRTKVWFAVFLPFPPSWDFVRIDAGKSSPSNEVKASETSVESIWKGIINAQRRVNFDFNKRYDICIEASHTPCDTTLAIRSLFYQMEKRPDTLAVIGPNCYHVISTLAQTIQWWNVVEIVFNVNEGELANRRLFPTLVRTMPSLRAQLVPLTTIMAHYNWSVIDVVHNDDPRCYEKYNQLIGTLASRDIRVGTVCVFGEESRNNDTTCANVMHETRNNIKVYLGEGEIARRYFCQVHKLGGLGRKQNTIWFMIGNFDNGWWSNNDVNCTSEEMTQAVSGHFLIDDRSSASFRPSWKASVTSWAYDTIIAASSSLDIALKGQLEFKDGERQSTLFLRQFQTSDYVTTGRYEMMTQSLVLNKSVIAWPGTGVGAPLDRVETLLKIDYLSPYIVSMILTFSVFGIILALLFLAFNIRHRTIRIIKMSSPNLNNVIVVGCVTAYVSLILSCLQTKYVTPSAFDILCKIRNLLPTCAFTLAFGTMFLKTWRVHAIFTNVTVKKKVISDYQLFGILAVFLSVDVVVLTTWHVVDPIKRVVKNASDERWDEQENFFVIFQNEFCQSSYAILWLGIICVYKGVLLVFGLFLAWETRHVALTTLNDSKYIGASVYVTVVACVIGPTTSFALRDYLNLSFTISTLSILLCTTATLCLVFVPKVTALRRMRDNPDALMHVRLRGIQRKGASERPVRKMLSMTIRNTPGVARMMSETVESSVDEKRSSSSQSHDPSSIQDIKNLRARLRTERIRLEKILEDKNFEFNSAVIKDTDNANTTSSHERHPSSVL